MRHSKYLQWVIYLALFATTVPLSGSESFLGIYCTAQDTTFLHGEQVAFSPLESISLEVAIINEEGGMALYFADPMSRSLDLEVLRDGERVPHDLLDVGWNEKSERYSFGGGSLPEGEFPGIVDPGVGVSSSLSIARRDGRSFEEGDYRILVRLGEEKVKMPQGESWSGLGGLGGVQFALREAVGLEEKQRRLIIEGNRKARQGNLEAARDAFLDLVGLDSANSFAYDYLGMSYLRLREHGAAVRSFEKSLALRPAVESRPLVPLLLAKSYLHLDQTEEAERVLRSILPEERVVARVAMLEQLLHAERASDTDLERGPAEESGRSLPRADQAP